MCLFLFDLTIKTYILSNWFVKNFMFQKANYAFFKTGT